MLLQIFCIGLVAGVTSVNPLGSDNLGIWPAPAASSPAPHQPRPPARRPGLLLGELNLELDHLAAQPAWPLPRQPPGTINDKERFL